MATRIYRNATSDDREQDVGIATEAATLDEFIEDLADLLISYDGAISSLGAGMGDPRRMEKFLKNAFAIGFKLQGYKSERVTERRVLSCGNAVWRDDQVVADTEKMYEETEEPAVAA